MLHQVKPETGPKNADRQPNRKEVYFSKRLQKGKGAIGSGGSVQASEGALSSSEPGTAEIEKQNKDETKNPTRNAD